MSDTYTLSNIYTMIFIDVLGFIFFRYLVYPEMVQHKIHTEFIGYGTTMNDAIYGNKYGYHLIVESNNNKIKKTN
jgi:hypothetical protein